MSRWSDMGADLQSGAKSIDIVGRRKHWFVISAILVLISLAGLGTRQLDLGVEFDGGSVFEVSSNSTSIEDVREIVEEAGAEEPKVQKLGGDRYRVETDTQNTEDAAPISQALAEKLGVPLEDVSTQVVGPSWGDDVTKKALTSLLIFLALLAVYLTVAFAPKMALGALAALLHDLVITIGIYSIVGFTVTPATVIGLLTILGYSLYDTVVVFDKVRENTENLEKQARYTYSGAANLAVNQTLVRSINTTIIALLPVAGLLFVGAGLLGAGTLKDLALVLFVGMAVGAYSSIFLATPVVAALKEREPGMIELRKKVVNRQAALRKQGAAGTPAATAGGTSTVTLDKPGVEDEPDRGPKPAPGERAQPRRGGSREQRNKKR